MRSLTSHYPEDMSILDRVQAEAAKRGITTEQMVKRYIVAGLNGAGWEDSNEAKNIDDDAIESLLHELLDDHERKKSTQTR